MSLIHPDARARLDAIAREIEAKLKKADKAKGYSDDMVVSVDQLVAEGARLCDSLGVKFSKWLREKCPNIGKSRAYEQRAIALGIKSAAEIRASTQERLARHVTKFSVNGKNVTLGADTAHLKSNLTGEIEWHTPPEWIKRVRAAMGGIDCDPASNATAQKYIRANEFFTIETDGLARQWRGNVFLNPPYAHGLVNRFVDKLLAEIAAKRTAQAVLLVNAYPETAWFQAAAKASAAMCFAAPRIKFLLQGGDEKASPVAGSVFLFFGANAAAFKAAFAGAGFIVRLASSRPPEMVKRKVGEC